MKRTILSKLAAVAALAFLATTVAFTEQKGAQEQTWFYTSDDFSEQALAEPSNYSLQPEPGVDCGGDNALCSIQDEAHPDNQDQPALSRGDVMANPIAYSATFRQTAR